MAGLRENPLLRARVTEGKIVWHGVDEKRWETVKTFLEGQEVEITIGRWRKKRSGAQNRYYWRVVLTMIAEAAGYSTREEAHDALRMHFLLEARRHTYADDRQHHRAINGGVRRVSR